MTTWADKKSAARFAATEGLDAKWVDVRVGKILESCHPHQRAFVEDAHRRITALCGRRCGKTTAIRARLVIRMLRTPRARCLFIALTRESAKLLIWNDLKDLCERLGIAAEFNETALVCTFTRNGSTLKLGGCDSNAEVDKFRGLKFHEVAVDEAASFPAKRISWLIDRVIVPALGDYRGTLVLGGTPGHVLQGIFYDATRPGSELHRPYADRENPTFAGWLRWSSHAWALTDGAPYVEALANAWQEALDAKAANQWSDDHPVWMREWLGLWAADSTENIFKYRPHLEDGAAWNQWDPERIGELGVARLPELGARDWMFALGIDMGSSDLFALTAWAFSPSDPTRTIYQVYEFADKKMYAKRIAELLLGPGIVHERPAGVIGALGEWPAAMAADLAGLGGNVIDELRAVYGISIAGADKGWKYKFPAIELTNGDLVDGRIKVLKGSKLETELLQLQWIPDEYGRLTENKSQANHHSDSMIYARLAISKLFEAGGFGAAPPGDPPPDDGSFRTRHRDADDFGGGSVFDEYRDPMGLD